MLLAHACVHGVIVAFLSERIVKVDFHCRIEITMTYIHENFQYTSKGNFMLKLTCVGFTFHKFPAPGFFQEIYLCLEGTEGSQASTFSTFLIIIMMMMMMMMIY